MPTPHKATSPFPTPVDRVGQVFVEKYDTLMQWALRLTHGDQEEAKDLLHEAFVQFTLRQLDFTGVENIDGYLYTALKHFHLATLKRAKRDPLNQISLVEFDSVDLALRSSFCLDQLEVQNDLRRICAFLCWRKASAKSASYLILRFFHGYYPEEIMRVALASRRVVDEGIRLAAAESKVYLGDPRTAPLHAAANQGQAAGRVDAGRSGTPSQPRRGPVCGAGGGVSARADPDDLRQPRRGVPSARGVARTLRAGVGGARTEAAAARGLDRQDALGASGELPAMPRYRESVLEVASVVGPLSGGEAGQLSPHRNQEWKCRAQSSERHRLTDAE